MPKAENLIGKTFREKPERINRKGRPRRFVSSVIKDLERNGIENVKPSQIIDLYEKLMNCTIKQLSEIANEDNAAWEVRQTAKYMLKNPEKAWMDIKDRAHGKAMQRQEIETIDTVVGFEVIIKEGG
jgi:hypothetical protein